MDYEQKYEIMKKFIVALAIAIMPVIALAGGFVSPEDLPKAANEFLSKQYAGQPVISANRQCRNYEVLVKNGTRIKFSRKGELREIEARRLQSLPRNITSSLPEKAAAYIKGAYPMSGISYIEKTRSKLYVRLSGIGRELVFDKDGKYLGVDM